MYFEIKLFYKEKIILVKVRIGFIWLLGLFLIACQSKENKYVEILDKSQESCVVCHGEVKGFSDAHDPKVIGCSACHLGDNTTDDKEDSHKGMIKIPGNLSNAAHTCSTTNCHRSELDRINKSLMTTNSGIVSIDKFAFEEVHHTDTFFHIENIKGTAADRHIKNLCFKCHLGYEKKHYNRTAQLSRGGGCLACHLNYSDSVKVDINDLIHPAINLNVSNDKCFGCHSRSGRISTNYEGWYETLFTEDEVKDSNNYRILDDGRVFGFASEDVHHKAGLLCIDCHVSQEIMGDGNKYKHEHEAVKIQCTDCHRKKDFNVVEKVNAGEIATLDYVLREYIHSTDKFLVTEKDSLPLVNTVFDNEGNAFLVGKLNQEKHLLNPLSDKCEKDKVHRSLDCTMCHTQWAPSCIGCHTGYDDKVVLKGGKKGKWYELLGDFGFSKPVMGTQIVEGEKKIKPAIPGMILTLDKSNFHGDKSGNDSIFLRLFAPNSAHTTVKAARTCKSCHNNSEALGYGKGDLKYIVEKNRGYWEFESLYDVSPQDSLPQDSWIGFLKDVSNNKKYSAHEGFFPLSLFDQKKVLQVGACLECHSDDKKFVNEMIYGDFKKLIRNKKKICIVPFEEM